MTSASRFEKIFAIVAVAIIASVAYLNLEFPPGYESRKPIVSMLVTVFYPIVSLGCILFSEPLSSMPWKVQPRYQPSEKAVRFFGWCAVMSPVLSWLFL